MATHDVAIIGTGDPSGSGYAMAYHHANAYAELADCRLTACADIVPEHATAFATEYGIDEEGTYTDHETMLAEAAPDIVSITVPPAVHADVVVDAVRAPGVAAVHCEKPMDYTWGGARLMAQEADRHDVKLTFNHQRRFGKPFRLAKELLDDGEIGALTRVECGPSMLYDYGSHSLDLCGYYADEAAPDWVMGQIDYTEENLVFGAHNANHAIVTWAYENGVTGYATAGSGTSDAVGCHNRLIGTEGTIEIGPADGPTLRISRGDGWEEIDTEGEGLHGWEYLNRAVADVVRAVDEDDESELCARNALNATEIIFATYESARRRERIDCPLEIDDNPLVSMVDTGALRPASPDED